MVHVSSDDSTEGNRMKVRKARDKVLDVEIVLKMSAEILQTAM